jgi:hypothetical protein
MAGAEELGKIVVDLIQLKAQLAKYLRTENNAEGIPHTF